MRVLLINVVCGVGSTGRICTATAEELEAEGHEVRIAYGREPVPAQWKKYAIKIGTEIDVRLHGVRSRLMDQHGLGSVSKTRRFLAWAEEYDPDLLWLHNIHGYYINYELLFDWIKSRPNMQVKWTLHDCWAFTGHCTHFTLAKCERWKTGCSGCPQTRSYPASLFLDNSKENYRRKKASFTGVEKMTLIAPSHWLAVLVGQSFLGEYRVEVHHNTIDTASFKPTPSDFRERFGLKDKKIVLGVAGVWTAAKGINDFIQLASVLDDSYRIVLVGLAAKQLKKLPEPILGLPHTDSKTELAEIYTASDVYVNATYEDNYPTTNLEAMACGTPVITYKTGGSVESVPAKNQIEPGDIIELAKRISQVVNEHEKD